MFVRRAGGLATSIHLQPTKIETTSYGGYTGKKRPSQSERLSRQTLTKYTEREGKRDRQDLPSSKTPQNRCIYNNK